jgi:hypothetical protein
MHISGHQVFSTKKTRQISDVLNFLQPRKEDILTSHTTNMESKPKQLERFSSLAILEKAKNELVKSKNTNSVK